MMSSSTFVACGSSDDVQNEWYSPDTDDDFGNNNNSDPTLDLVKKNTSASVSYGDYSWNIAIKSKLSSVFPGKSMFMGSKVAMEITNTTNISSLIILTPKRMTAMAI